MPGQNNTTWSPFPLSTTDSTMAGHWASEGGEPDAKTQIAQRIFQALMHDAMVQIAMDQHDREARERRAQKSKATDGIATTTEDTTMDALEEGERRAGDDGDDDHEDEDMASSRADSTSPRKPLNGSNSINAASQSRATSLSAQQRTTTPSRASTSGTPGPGLPPSTSTNTGSANLISSTYSANPLIRCLVCNRHVASNRYAPHLAKCMGLGASGGAKNSSSGLKRKAAANAAAAAAAAAATGMGSAANSPAPSSSSTGTGKVRGRPPKYAKDRNGTASARSTATPGP